MKVFDLDKKYIFDKEIALKDEVLTRHYNSSAITREWVHICDGKEVAAINENNGRIQGNNIIYSIIPEWCKKVG